VDLAANGDLGAGYAFALHIRPAVLFLPADYWLLWLCRGGKRLSVTEICIPGVMFV